MRWLRHLFADSARRLFPAPVLQRIAEAIARDESRHRGEVCFAAESALSWRRLWRGLKADGRAAEVFVQLGVWNTAENNGVLIYLLLADHRIEIRADRGLDGRVSAEQWRGVCLLMEERLRAGDAEAAVLRGVEAIGDVLTEHFPKRADDTSDRNELSDMPQLLS